MPRPEKPVETPHARLATLALGLRELRAQHSELTYRELARRTGYAISVLSEAASGRRAPSWDVVKAYVEACNGDPSDWLEVWTDAAEDVRKSQSHNPDLSDRPASAMTSYAHAGALINLQQTSFAESTQQPSQRPENNIPPPSPIRIFLVDDHEIVRRGVADLLEDEPDLEIVGEAATVTEALSLIPSYNVDVAVLDVRMPDGNGVELCRDLRAQLPKLGCLILTSYSDDEALFNAIMAGASGFVLKQVVGTELISAVRTVGAGGSLLDTGATDTLMRRIRQRQADSPLTALTDQERAVFDLVGEGLTNRQIASQLFLAEKSVKNYVSHILTKLGMQRRTQAVVLAAELKPRKTNQ